MRIYPAPHYSMGGLWVDYELQTTIPGLFAIGESNFSDHGANRLGASAMMQCLADGYFVVPHTVTHYLSGLGDHIDTSHPAFAETAARVGEKLERLRAVGGTTSPTVFHRELGHVMLDRCGISRTAEGLEEAITKIRAHPRGVLARPADRRRRPGAQPDARVRGAGRRLPRVRRADVPRRDRARRVLRLPPARGAPDRGRRGAARRPPLRSHGDLGVHTARTPSRSATPKSWSSTRWNRRRGATSEVHARDLAAGGRRRPRGGSSPTRSTTSTPRPRSWRCSTCSTSG